VLEQAVLNGYLKKEIDLEDLPEFLQGSSPPGHAGPVAAMRDTLSDAERRVIEDVLRAAGGNKTGRRPECSVFAGGFV